MKLIPVLLTLLFFGALFSFLWAEFRAPSTPDATPVPGTPPLITPNESNTIKRNVTPVPQWKRHLFSLEEAPQLTVQPLYVLTRLPPGFTYQGGSLDSNGVISLTLSNASQTVTFLQGPPWSDVGAYLEDPGVRHYDIHEKDRTCVCSEPDGSNRLIWREGDRDYYLIGLLGCDDLFLMAGSLKPLDYEILDRLPYTVSDPGNPFPVPERIRLIFPLAWIRAQDPDKYPSRMEEIAMSSEEFNASFSPDPRDPTVLRHRDVQENGTVVYLTLPRDLFDQFSIEPGGIRIRYPNGYFQNFANMETFYEAHGKDPDPPGWKPRTPDSTGTMTVPATPLMVAG